MGGGLWGGPFVLLSFELKISFINAVRLRTNRHINPHTAQITISPSGVFLNAQKLAKQQLREQEHPVQLILHLQKAKRFKSGVKYNEEPLLQ
jgi:hypothetical protein